jgi:hypothetical protein
MALRAARRKSCTNASTSSVVSALGGAKSTISPEESIICPPVIGLLVDDMGAAPFG